MDTKRVRDLMLPLEGYATVPSGSTLREALAALDRSQLGLDDSRQHHRAVLVLGPGRQVLGKLTHWALLKSLDPGTLDAADRRSLDRAGLPERLIDSLERNSSRLSGTLERMCAESARMRVDDAMGPVGESIEEDARLIEAIHVLADTHQQSLLVTRRGEAVGVLRLSDVFEAVAEAIVGGCDAGETP